MSNKNIAIIAIVILSFVLGAFTGPKLLEKITRSQAAEAASIIGLEMTDAEIDSLLPDLESARQDYISNREISISNEVVPSLLFNPLPPGFKLESRQSTVKFSDSKGVKLPKNRDELAFFTVRELYPLKAEWNIGMMEGA